MGKPTKVTAWQDAGGVLHTSIEGWQVAELRALLNEIDGSGAIDAKALDLLAADLVRHAEPLLEILTTGPRSRPVARKRPGTSNPKRATKAQASTGFRAMRAAADGDVAITMQPTELATQ